MAIHMYIYYNQMNKRQSTIDKNQELCIQRLLRLVQNFKAKFIAFISLLPTADHRPPQPIMQIFHDIII